jgi:hypothetical protein
LFGGTVGKDTVSRTWRKVKSDWDAWHTRSLTGEPIVRLILDGTVVRVRLDRKATSISLLVVLGVREDGQKVLLAIKSMGGESAEAWRLSLLTSSIAGCGVRNSSSSMARRGSTRMLSPSGPNHLTLSSSSVQALTLSPRAMRAMLSIEMFHSDRPARSIASRPSANGCHRSSAPRRGSTA